MLRSLVSGVRAFLARSRPRLRERRFWVVQALVVAITVLHGLVEALALLGEHEGLAFVPVSFYLVPVLYAGLYYGVEGALPTVVLSTAFATPNAFFWHSSLQRLGEAWQMALVAIVGILVAQRVDRERASRERTEQVGARLAQLHETAAATSRSLDPQLVVRGTLAAVVDEAAAEAVWVTLASRDVTLPAVMTWPDSASERVSGYWQRAAGAILEHARSWTTSSADTAHAPTPDGEALLVPVQIGGELIGVLGLWRRLPPLTGDDLSLLTGVAHQLAVALDNCRHYQAARTAVEELASAEANLRDYLRLATDAQEEERKRLARELHDETIQTLVVIKAGLDALATEDPRAAAYKLRLASHSELLESAVDGIRRFSRALRPTMLDDLGLVLALEWLTSDITRRTGIEARLVVEGTGRRLSPESEVAVYRIVQEALHNVEKHSGATNTRVILTFESQRFRAQVIDDGAGFDVAQVLARKTRELPLGLIGMKERAGLAGGSLDIDSQTGRGTRVVVSLATPPVALSGTVDLSADADRAPEPG